MDFFGAGMMRSRVRLALIRTYGYAFRTKRTREQNQRKAVQTEPSSCPHHHRSVHAGANLTLGSGLMPTAVHSRMFGLVRVWASE